MTKVCELCQHKERMICKKSKILDEDLPKIFETKFLKSVKLKASIKTKKGITELYHHTLEIRRAGYYDAVAFSNFPCLACINCTLKHHMEKGYDLVSNRKLVRCVGLLGVTPEQDEYVAYFLINKQ